MENIPEPRLESCQTGFLRKPSSSPHSKGKEAKNHKQVQNKSIPNVRQGLMNVRRQIPHFSWKVPGRKTCQRSDYRVCSNTPHTNSSHLGASRDEETSTNMGTSAAKTVVSSLPSTAGSNSRTGICFSQFTYSLEVFLHFPQPGHHAIRHRLQTDSEPMGFQALQRKDWPKDFLTSKFSRNRGPKHSSWSGGSAGSHSPHCRNSIISQYSWRNQPPKTSFPHAMFLTLPNDTAEV